MRRDPGLQPQRTRLAWVRTALGAAGAGALMIKGGIDAHTLGTACAGALAVVSGLVIAVLSRRRRIAFWAAFAATAARTRAEESAPPGSPPLPGSAPPEPTPLQGSAPPESAPRESPPPVPPASPHREVEVVSLLVTAIGVITLVSLAVGGAR